MSHPPSPTPLVHRVVVVEDHPVVRAGMIHVLESQPHFVVCASTGEPRAAADLVRKHQPDIVVLDVMLDGRENLSLITDFLAIDPAVKVLVLSMLDESIYAEKALRAGAVGYVMKSADTAEIQLALRNLVEGRVYLSPKIFVTLFRGLLKRTGSTVTNPLSDRELQVYQLIGAGIPNRDIAKKLGVSVKTVETHRENIKSKLGLHDARELSTSAQHYIATLCTEPDLLKQSETI